MGQIPAPALDPDEQAPEQHNDDGGGTSPAPPLTTRERAWRDEVAVHRHGYQPTPETQARAEKQTRSRAQKPMHIASHRPLPHDGD